MLTAILAGSLFCSLVLARWGDGIGRRRAYLMLWAALACGGVVIAVGAPWWLLAVVALTGALSVEVIESGPFTTLEQVMLAGTGRPQHEVVRGFGLYNAVAAVAGTAGALLGALPADRRLLGGVLVVAGVIGALLAARLPGDVEAPATLPGDVEAPATLPGVPRPRLLARSRGPVARLAALFAVDSLARGFVVQAYIGYWLSVHHGATTQTIGLTFAALGVLQTASLLAAPLVAARVGLLRTMVFTHIPSNLLLAAVPLVPGLPAAIALLLARACLSAMDVPTRQAYVMALVPPEERTAAAAVTNTARYLTRPAGPVLAGVLFPLGAAMPFLIAAIAKTGYDLSLWRIFRSVRLPADQHTP
ncbi:MFS transporter [Nonomuraea insulae]|uniref:MFS transporter n=1 Tax=Nonomuraea insulae TaxID=1616787 RepID=A0ABW1D3Y6_9ACTN